MLKLILLTVLLFGNISICLSLKGDLHTHDPSFIKSGKCYYIYSTGGSPYGGGGWAPMRKVCNDNTTIVNPSFIPYPEWSLPLTKTRAPTLWAPDANFFNNQFYVYYAISTFGSRNSVIGVATAKNVEGPYHDEGEVFHSVATDPHNAIDPEIAFTFHNTTKAEMWMIFGSFWEGIKMRRLDSQTGKLSAADHKLYSLASRNGGAIEGSSSCYRNGWYYLFVSFDRCCAGASSTYRVMVGRSRQITGPYVDEKGVEMMKGGGTQILASHDHIRGPGGPDVINDNGIYRMVYHYYDSTDNGVAKFNIVDLLWDNDWPHVGPDSKLNYN